MADLAEIVRYLDENATFSSLVNNPLAQFGPPEQQYLGATLLPERLVPENSFVEEGVQYRTVVANSGTRYSPVQKKGNVLTGTMRVTLGEQDIGSEMTARDYDALIRLVRQSSGTQGVAGNGVTPPEMAAAMQITKFVDMTLNRPLRVVIEKERFQALVNASVVRTGDDGYSETVSYPNPTNHRVTAGGTWSNNSYDPYTDIMSIVEMLAGKGYVVNRIITGTDVRTKLSNNANMKTRVGKVVISNGQAVNQSAGRATLTDLNELFSSDNLPPIELYDAQYRTQSGTSYYLPRGTMLFCCTTGRDESIDRGDAEPVLLPNTLGYAAIGRPQGQADPGRVVKVRVNSDRKPVNIEGEAWQSSLAVVTDPEAVAVISGIS